MRSIGPVLTAMGVILIAHFVNEKGLGPDIGMGVGCLLLLFGLNWIIYYCTDADNQWAYGPVRK
jgi:hypothetical protein